MFCVYKNNEVTEGYNLNEFNFITQLYFFIFIPAQENLLVYKQLPLLLSLLSAPLWLFVTLFLLLMVLYVVVLPLLMTLLQVPK